MLGRHRADRGRHSRVRPAVLQWRVVMSGPGPERPAPEQPAAPAPDPAAAAPASSPAWQPARRGPATASPPRHRLRPRSGTPPPQMPAWRPRSRRAKSSPARPACSTPTSRTDLRADHRLHHPVRDRTSLGSSSTRSSGRRRGRRGQDPNSILASGSTPRPATSPRSVRGLLDRDLGQLLHLHVHHDAGHRRDAGPRHAGR